MSPRQREAVRVRSGCRVQLLTSILKLQPHLVWLFAVGPAFLVGFTLLSRCYGFRRAAVVLIALLAAGPMPLRGASEALGAPIHSVAELRRASSESRSAHLIEIEAVVWYADPANGRLVLHDGTGTAEVQLDFDGHSLRPGDGVRIAGHGTIMNRGYGSELISLALLDNDGMHFERERSAALRLEPGRHPIRVDWFNAGIESRLSVDYEGPGLMRQRIPDAALFRKATTAAGDPEEWRRGLSFRTYRARQWKLPPQQNAGDLLLKGATDNFDFSVAGWREYVGATFWGYLEIVEAGEYRFYLRSDDGGRLFVGPPSLRVEKLAPVALPTPQGLFPGQALRTSERYLWATVEGRLARASQIGQPGSFLLESGAGHLRVEMADTTTFAATSLLDHPVRVTGVIRRNLSADGIAVASTLFVQDASQVERMEPPAVDAEPESAVPLTSVERIERLDRKLMDGRHRVRIRGVVTRVVSGVQGVVLQDQTRGVYVDFNDMSIGPLQLGELLEVVGNVEAGEFSPFIIARELTRLGAGVMPVPVAATREEMINGSLHSQYVEIEGYVMAVGTRSVTLRTRAGVLRIETETETAPEWVNAVVRMRGCLRVFWDLQSRQITVGRVGLDYDEIVIERPAPADLFDVAAKRASALLKFDPYAVAFQRTRLVGQVIHRKDLELYLMDDGVGVRVSLAEAGAFERGDLVEVAGFPEFDGPSPHFAHTVVRKLGREPLPTARVLASDRLLRDEYDSTLVSIDAELVGFGFQDGRRTLQLRAGPNAFLASFDDPPAEMEGYAPGSRLRLTGVYLGVGGNRTLGRPIDAFEIVLASAASVQVLATPPWWTLPRLLTLVGLLCVVLLLAFLWITILRRQVARQTEQLKIVLQERHRVQQEEALTRERSRLAYDLHDELGAGLSEIGMLSGLVSSPVPTEKREHYLKRLTETVRRLIASLDEIVWAVNPRYDAVASFVGYYTAYAQQYLELAAMRCRLDVAENLPQHALTSRTRHTLFLAFKETLTNVVKHAQATEVVIRIFTENRQLVIAVADNGRGLGGDEKVPGMDGLTSISERLRQLDGECVVESNGQQGTKVSLKLPLP